MDINFAKNDMRETELLEEMDTLDRAKKTKINQVQLINQGKQQGDVSVLNDEIIETIRKYKELKNIFVEIQEEKLYEKWEITGKNGRSESDKSILYAYVTFKSMRGKEMCMKQLEHAQANAKKNPEENEKMFFDRFLTVATCVAPSSIIWKNIQYSPCNRAVRATIVWIIAFGIVALAFYGMVRFKDYNDEIKAGASLDVKCPAEPVEAETALSDWDKPGKQR